MLDSKQCTELAKAIIGMANRAICAHQLRGPAWKIARMRRIRPVDYMRYAEFLAVFEMIRLKPDMRILDIGSPQFLSLYLAHKYPECQFYYVNILPREIEPFRSIAIACGIINIYYNIQDVRNISQVKMGLFDRALSISVIEHVAPENGGDVIAINRIRTVLKTGG